MMHEPIRVAPRPLLRRLRGLVQLATGTLVVLAARAEVAPIEITLRALNEQMKFDLKEFKVPVGRRVRLHFRNEDGMQHNVLICLPREMCEPGAAEDNAIEVAQAAWALGAEGPARHWIPKHPRVFAASTMLDGGKEEVIEFEAPQKAGAYPYICSFPGHAMLMVGTMHVQSVVAGLSGLTYTAYRAGDEPPFGDFETLRRQVLASGTLADGLIDATPAEISGHYAMEFTAVLPIPQDGEYSFSLAADKGTQLFIDGALAVDNRAGHSARAIKNGTIRLKAGARQLVMRYWHQIGDPPEASLVWSGPGFTDRALSRIDLVDRKRNNDGDLLEGMKLTPEHGEPVFYHNFLADLPEGGFAIGFPGGANLSWDPRNLNLSSLWAGDFLDVKAHRTSRGAGAIKPAGFDIVRPGPNRPFPPSAGDLRFVGYRFDSSRRPYFRYRIGALEVVESYAVSGEGSNNSLTITRELVFRGTPPTGGLTLIVAAGPNLSATPNGIVFDNKLRLKVREGAAVTPDGKGFGVPVVFSGNQAKVVLDYRWVATASRFSPHSHHD